MYAGEFFSGHPHGEGVLVYPEDEREKLVMPIQTMQTDANTGCWNAIEDLTLDHQQYEHCEKGGDYPVPKRMLGVEFSQERGKA